MIYEFQGYIPVVHESSFVHPLAAVTGNTFITVVDLENYLKVKASI